MRKPTELGVPYKRRQTGQRNQRQTDAIREQLRVRLEQNKLQEELLLGATAWSTVLTAAPPEPHRTPLLPRDRLRQFRLAQRRLLGNFLSLLRALNDPSSHLLSPGPR